MSRADELNRSYEKPADRYIEWSSDDFQFRYYDKEKEKNVLIPLPFKFVVLAERHTIKGFNEDKNCGFYANEVEDLSKEELNVKLFNGGTVAKGLYSDVKEKVAPMGACYAKSIYIQTLDGEIWNVSMKGAAVYAWGEFVKKNRPNLISHSVVVTSFEKFKKGKVDYSIPVFDWGKKMTAASAQKADELYDELILKLSARAQALKKEDVQDSKSKMLDSLRKGEQMDEVEDDDFANLDMPEEAEVDF